MINQLMSGNYSESINLLKNFERVNTSSISILYLIKSRLKLLKKCINLKKSGFTKNQIVNNKSLKIFYKEQPFFLKMLDLWSLSKIDSSLLYLFKTELSCKSNKNFEYYFLKQHFLYIFFKTKI